MNESISSNNLEASVKKRVTQRACFLAEMKKAAPWSKLMTLGRRNAALSSAPKSAEQRKEVKQSRRLRWPTK